LPPISRFLFPPASPPETDTLSLHDALPILPGGQQDGAQDGSSADDGTQGGSSSGADTGSSDGSDSTDDTTSATTDDGTIDNVAVTHFDELFTEFAILNRDG